MWTIMIFCKIRWHKCSDWWDKALKSEQKCDRNRANYLVVDSKLFSTSWFMVCPENNVNKWTSDKKYIQSNKNNNTCTLEYFKILSSHVYTSVAAGFRIYKGILICLFRQMRLRVFHKLLSGRQLFCNDILMQDELRFVQDLAKDWWKKCNRSSQIRLFFTFES